MRLEFLTAIVALNVEWICLKGIMEFRLFKF